MTDEAAPDLPWPQIAVTLGDKTYDLKPTFDAMRRIESRLGIGVVTLLQRFQLMQVGITDVTQILCEGIRAELGNAAPSFDALGEMVLREGVEACLPPAQEFLVAAMNGLTRRDGEGPETEAEAEEAPAGESGEDPPAPAGEDAPGSPGGSSSPRRPSSGSSRPSSGGSRRKSSAPSTTSGSKPRTPSGAASRKRR